MFQADLLRHPPEVTPEGQALLAESRERRERAYTPRERWAETAIAGGFILTAVALALAAPAERTMDWAMAGLVLACFVLATQVRFEVASCYTLPTQIVFVPALFLLPPETVPLLVAAAMLIGKFAEHLLAGKAMRRVFPAIGDAWFSLGPAVVFVAAGSPGPAEGALWLVPALVAQFAVETAAAAVREHLHDGATWREQLAEARWVYRVDTLLTPIGLAIAIAAAEEPFALLLVLPLFALLMIFARERTERIDSLLELSEAYRGTAKVLSRMVEHDDSYTGMHTRGVFELSADVAAEMKLTATQVRNVEFGALLHDIGKIAIPKDIINKPAPLTEDEWALMRTHTIAGQRILQEIGGLMADIGGIIRSAHERWDGGGYPDGLRGEEIPVESRVVFCCDAFNAMTTDRPYSSARSPREALDELRANSGTQFDPRAVEALIRVVEREPGAAHPARHGDGNGAPAGPTSVFALAEPISR